MAMVAAEGAAMAEGAAASAGGARAAGAGAKTAKSGGGKTSARQSSSTSEHQRKSANQKSQGAEGTRKRAEGNARESKTKSSKSSGILGGPHLKDPQKLLLGEFVACAVLLFMGYAFLDAEKQETAHVARRFTGLCGLFLILSLISSGGKGPAKFSAGLGLIILLAYLINERQLWIKIANLTGIDTDEGLLQQASDLEDEAKDAEDAAAAAAAAAAAQEGA